jgi:hypothetical protein
MPIEIRQLVIRSTVGAEVEDERHADSAPPSMDALKEEILSECKAWFEARLQQLRER